MRCNRCGAELLSNDTFCGSCGAKVVTHSDNDSSSKPFKITYEEEKTPYSDTFKVPNNANSFSSSNKTRNNTKQLSQTAKSGKSKTSGLIVVLVIVLLLLTAFTVFNFLLMTDRIDTFKYDMFEGYKESMAEFLHLPYEAERNEKTNNSEVQPETTESTTVPISSTQSVKTITTMESSEIKHHDDNETGTKPSDMNEEKFVSESTSMTSSSNIETRVDNTQTISPFSSSYQIGDSITFGAIDQDNDPVNGAEDIEWLILDIKDNQFLVISRYALDCIPYHNVASEISWPECSLRAWLNSSFLNKAFTVNEQENIMTTNSPLSDKVFLLSINEANDYFLSPESRMTSATKTAVANGSYQENGICGWWLRDSGDANRTAARVNKNGEIVTYDSTEGGVERRDYSVRPAIWITIN